MRQVIEYGGEESEWKSEAYLPSSLAYLLFSQTWLAGYQRKPAGVGSGRSLEKKLCMIHLRWGQRGGGGLIRWSAIKMQRDWGFEFAGEEKPWLSTVRILFSPGRSSLWVPGECLLVSASRISDVWGKKGWRWIPVCCSEDGNSDEDEANTSCLL